MVGTAAALFAAAAYPGRVPVCALPPPTALPAGTHPLAVDLNGRTERRTLPARCPTDHGRAIRLTPQSRDPADTRNQASDFGHLHRRFVWGDRLSVRYSLHRYGQT